MFGESIMGIVAASSSIDLSDYEDENAAATECELDDFMGLQAGVEALTYSGGDIDDDDYDDDEGSVETDLALSDCASLFSDTNIYDLDSDDEPDADIDHVDISDPGDDLAELDDDFMNNEVPTLESSIDDIFDFGLETSGGAPSTVKVFSTDMDIDNNITDHGPSSDDIITDDDIDDEDCEGDPDNDDDDCGDDDDDVNNGLIFIGDDNADDGDEDCDDDDCDGSMESVSASFDSVLRDLL